MLNKANGNVYIFASDTANCRDTLYFQYSIWGRLDSTLKTSKVDMLVDFGDGKDTVFQLTAWNNEEISYYGYHRYVNYGIYTAKITLTCNGIQVASKSVAVYLSNSCKQISGDAYYDSNKNCLKDANEVPIGGATVICESLYNNSYHVKLDAITDANGHYVIDVPIDTLKYTVYLYNYTCVCPATNQYGVIVVPAVCDFAVKKSSTGCYAYFQGEKDSIYQGIHFYNMSKGSYLDTYSWNFGDGSTSNDTSISFTHLYKKPGVYNVCLSIASSLDSCHSMYCDTVIVNDTAPSSICNNSFYLKMDSNNPLRFQAINYSTGYQLKYHWDFGDGNSASLANPYHTYAIAGSYNVCLTISTPDSSCTKQNCSAFHAYPNTACNASYYGWRDSTVFDSAIYVFSNYSTGHNLSYHWDFGDGTSSSEVHPKHFYAQHGTYNVCLYIQNGDSSCKDTLCAVVYVSKCLANFQYNKRPDGKTIDYIPGPQSANVNYFWDFGDGSSSSSMKPSYTYSNPGNYNVCLYLSSNDSSCSAVWCTYVYVEKNKSCDATFYALKDSIVAQPLVYRFSGVNPSADKIYTWDFGDGNISFVGNPSHVYAKPGYYNVCLSVSSKIDSTCKDKVCQGLNVMGIDSNCHAVFTTTMDTLSNGGVVYFHNYSTGDSLNSFWYFGDGYTSNDKNPVHKYNIGGYTACLYISNADSSCWDKYCYQFNVPATNTSCKANFAMLKDSLSNDTSNMTYTFWNYSYSMSSSLTYFWDFGDGSISTQKTPSHQFKPGKYNVCLTVSTLDSSCHNTYCITYVIGNNMNPCDATIHVVQDSTNVNSLTCHFFGTNPGGSKLYYWNFGDGNTTYQTSPTHTYAQSGQYTICLMVYDKLDSTCKDYKCMVVNVPGVNTTCKSAFIYFPDTLVADNRAFQFANQAVGSKLIYHWDFGDGTTSNQVNPYHIFSSPVNHNVCLTVTNADSSCMDSYCMNIKAGCRADFSSEFDPATNTIEVHALQSKDLIYFWSFSDGATANGPDAIHTYHTIGSYTVSLTVTNKDATCSDKSCYIFQVVDNKLCRSFFDILRDTLSNDTNAYILYDLSKGNNLSYTWDFGDGTSSSLQLPTHTYNGSGPYTICLTVASDSCSDTYCDTIYEGLKKTGGPLKFKVVSTKPTNLDKVVAKNMQLNCYPNPSSGIATIRYVLPEAAQVNIEVYNVVGIKVADIINGTKEAGEHRTEWYAMEIPNGIYLVRLSVEGIASNFKLVIER